MNFCVAILILKMEENMQHFQHIMLHYFKKGKNATEMQKKICAVCGEDAVSALPNFVWGISHWMLLQGRVDQLKLIKLSDQIETLIENSQHYTMREIANILKISKSAKLLVKMKKMTFILWKKTQTDFLANLILKSLY